MTRPEPSSSPHRGVLIAMLSFIFFYLIFRLIQSPVYVSDPQPHVPPRAAELQDKLDPNTADWSTLAALPQIGEKRARDIVTYREQFQAENPGRPAFTRPEDLYRIRGFGVAMVSLIEPYLVFPKQNAPQSRPIAPDSAGQ